MTEQKSDVMEACSRKIILAFLRRTGGKELHAVHQQRVGVRSRGDVSLFCTAIPSCREGSHGASWGCEVSIIPRKGKTDIVVIHGDRGAGREFVFEHSD